MKRLITIMLALLMLVPVMGAQEAEKPAQEKQKEQKKQKEKKPKPPKLTSAQKKDMKLEEKAREVLKEDPDFIQVKVFVDDRVATLRGTVDLLSQRIRAEERVRKLRGVQRVNNEIALFPAALPDEVLRSRIESRLQSADMEGVKFQVQQGRVVTTGGFASRRQRQKIADIIQSTDGVKEYEDRSTVANR